jgi:hypothetical protein
MPKQAGRPEMPENQKRQYIVRFVVTKAEALAIRKKARSLGLTVSEYLRSVAVPK